MKNDTKINQLFRMARVLGSIAQFFVESSLIQLNKNDTLRQRAMLCQKYAKKILKTLNVNVMREGHGKLFSSGLLVSNHLSYLDILVICADIPTLFITSIETQNSGWIGRLCVLAGCLFVERRKANQLGVEVRQIEIALALGIPVTLFPEATSSPGKTVLPFKSSLYECAIQAKVPIHNFLIRYDDERVPYFGDMTLFRHLFHLCGSPKINAHFEFLDTFHISEKSERKILARASHDLICTRYASAPKVAPPLIWC